MEEEQQKTLIDEEIPEDDELEVVSHGIVKEMIIIALRGLSDEERMEVFGSFCRECGSKYPGCQCWNDE